MADFNGDSKLDFAVANYNSFNSSVFLGNGDGTLQAGRNFATEGDDNQIVTLDLNGDGKPDFVVGFPGTSTGGFPIQIFMQGSFPVASFSLLSVAFAQQAIGITSPPQAVTLTNTGTAMLNISNITITGANAGDFVQTGNCSSSLAVNASCRVSVTFTPTAGGNRNAALTVADNAPGSPQAFPLTGRLRSTCRRQTFHSPTNMWGPRVCPKPSR